MLDNNLFSITNDFRATCILWVVLSFCLDMIYFFCINDVLSDTRFTKWQYVLIFGHLPSSEVEKTVPS